MEAADEGQTIKVKVSFTDDADNDERLTSAATGEVEARPNRPATALTLGIPLGGTIDPGNDEDYFKLVLSTAQTILVWTTGDLDTVGELQDSGGMELESNDYGGLPEGPHNFVIWRDVQDGTYYLKVSSRDEVTGAYVLHAISIQDTTSTSNAVTVSPDSSTPALVEKRFDYDYFKLTLAAETDLIIRTTGSVLETYMEILDNSQTQIATNNYGLLPPRDTHALIRRSLAAGTYFIKVRGPVATESLGPYTLHIRTVSEPGDSITNAIPLVIHRAEGGNVDSATDADYFRIDVAETTHLRIRAVSETVDIDGALLDSGGQSLPAIFYEETLLGGDAMVFRLRRTLDAGTYYVKVTRSGGAEAGPYTILMVDDPDLEALLDRCSGLDTTVSDPLFGCQWNLRNTGQLGGTAGEDINVEPVWAGGNMGAGITVVVVDKHLDLLHEDLTTDAAKSHQYYDPPYYVDHSHATDVAGIIAGRDNNLGVRGVAPRATVIGHDAIAAVGFFVVLPVPLDALTRNMDVAAVYNNSYGKSSGAEPETAPRSWEEALQTGVSDGYGGKGVFYVFGAGNDAEEGGNVNLDEYANLHHVTTVCAVNDLGQRSAYSEEGANLWVCAPSNDGTRDRPLIFTTTNYSAYTDYFGGTSAAAPTVSGVAALVRAANTSLTWRDVKLILAASARKNDATNTGWEEGAFEYGSSTQRYEFNHEYGFGVVNAGAAVTLADSWTSLPAYIETTAAWDGPAAAIPDLPSSGTAVSLERAVVVGPDVEFTEFVEINVEFVAVTSADDVRQFRELEIELESPSGAVSVLAPAINDIAMCPLHDSCGLEGGFRFGSAKHLGEDPGGEWKLRITDRKTGSTPGTLESWSLTVYGHRIRPSAPELDEVFPASGGYTVIWKAPEDTGQSSITAYDVRHIKTSEDETDDANWTVVDSAWTTGALQYTAIGLDSTEPYDVQVRAVNDGGDGRWSSTSTVTPKTDEAPTIETITAGNGTLTVAWTAPTSTTLGTITAYDLRYGRGTPSSSWTTVDDAWTSGTLEYAIEPDPLLTNGVTYGVQVRAVVGTDDKPWSETRTGTPRTVPGAPSIRSVDDGSGGELIVEWNAPSSNGGADITGYDVRYIRSDATAKADGNWTEELAIWTSGTREHTIDSVDNWVRYDVQVRAENSVGKGSWSATESGTPQEADVPSVTANFEQSSYNVTEGGDVSIAVTLSADPERSVAIPITTTNQGTATDADYSGVPLEVTFQSGDTEVTFTFTATDDPVDDDGEWVKVTFGALPAGVSEGTTTEATVSITDNDVSGVTVSETALTVPEGGTAGETYTVVLDSPPTADVVVTVAGHAGTEVTPSPTSLTFTTSNWNDAHRVTVKAGDDADTLDDTVTLTHMAQSTDSNYEGITIDGVAVTVNDDDTTNTPATGAPTIRGTVQVGETLTAYTAGITDDDGLNNVSYGYQWIRNDGTSDTEIQDATGETYPLVDADEGKTIKVKVSFTDDADNEEALTSTATAEVAAVAPTEPPGRPRNLTGAANADGTVTLSWDAPNDDTVTGYQILRRKPREGEKTLLVHVNDTGSTATQHTDRDVTPDVGHAYRVKAINAVGLSRWSNFVNVTPVQPAEPAQNSPATGRPTISGTAQVGETLTANTSGIADADGLENATFSYQWIRNDGTSDTDITDATRSRYTLVDADEGQTLKVRVTFTDDVGHDETLTSASTAAIAAEDPQSQEPPAKPTGLTATVSHDSVSLTWDDPGDESITGYQMLRRDRALHAIGEFLVHVDDTGNANTTFTDNDVEPSVQYVYRIKAKNNAGLSELSEWVRANMPAPTRDPNSPATGVPTVTGTAQVGEVLTADTSGIADADGLENATFSYQWIRNDGSTETDIQDATGSIYTLVDADEGQTIKVKVSFTDDAGNEETLTSTATEAVAARPNTSATGRPTISGTVRVGEVLTADTTGIADADGLTNVSYSYQWVANDGTSDADIGGATGSTYTLTASEQGQTIRVRVSFTDDAGNETTLTSAATEAVAARPNTSATGRPTISGPARVGETLTVDTSGIADADGLENATFSYQWVGNDGSADTDITGATDTSYTLVADDVGQTIKVRVSFSDDAGNETTLTSTATEAVAARPNTSAMGRPSISGTVRVGEVLTADTLGIADDDGLTNVSYGYQWVAGGTDLGGATGSTYTLTASEQGKTIRVRVSFTDDAGNQESLTSAATDEVAVRPNSPATGQPIISGTVRVGDMLTADTSGIADADGLDNVSYRYQWVVTDRGAYFDISGETGATYTLVAADRGLYIQVRVSFTDDAGKRETLTSALTDVVAAAP